MKDVQNNARVAGRDRVVPPPLVHSINSACRQLSMGRSWLYAEIAAGRIKTLKLGSRTLITMSELDRVVNEAGRL